MLREGAAAVDGGEACLVGEQGKRAVLAVWPDEFLEVDGCKWEICLWLLLGRLFEGFIAPMGLEVMGGKEWQLGMSIEEDVSVNEHARISFANESGSWESEFVSSRDKGGILEVGVSCVFVL